MHPPWQICAARLHAIVAACALAGCSKPPPLSSEAYVWQQVRTDAVDRAIDRAAPVLDGFCLHAADVSFRGGEERITRFEIPWPAAAAANKRIGIAIRIPFAGDGLGSSPAHAEKIAALIRSILDAGKSAGCRCDEVQIDYDCPESKLALYADFLTRLKASLSGIIPVAFTALPSWLRSPRFPALARTTGSYVLQVHSLTLPGPNDSTAVICDVPRARSAIAAAEKIGVPFRVALPTYRCLVLLDARGNRVDVISEEAVLSLPAGVRAVPGTSDPSALAALVANLLERPPRSLRGLIWYRLPVDTDAMNWSWRTFLAVSAGRQPVSRLRVATVDEPEGYASVEIRNEGEKSERLPAAVEVRWQAGTFEAADALGLYRLDSDPAERRCVFRLAGETLLELPPEKTKKIGWIRLDGSVSTDVRIIEPESRE